MQDTTAEPAQAGATLDLGQAGCGDTGWAVLPVLRRSRRALASARLRSPPPGGGFSGVACRRATRQSGRERKMASAKT